MGSSGSFANGDAGERGEQPGRRAEAGLATRKGHEGRSVTQITSMLLQFNHFREARSQHRVRCLDSVKVEGFRYLGTQDTSLNWTFDGIWQQGCRGSCRSGLQLRFANLLTFPWWSVTTEWCPQSTAQGGQMAAAPPGGFRAETCHQKAGRGASH